MEDEPEEPIDNEPYDFTAEECEALYIAWLRLHTRPKPPLKLPDLTKLVF